MGVQDLCSGSMCEEKCGHSGAKNGCLQTGIRETAVFLTAFRPFALENPCPSARCLLVLREETCSCRQICRSCQYARTALFADSP